MGQLKKPVTKKKTAGRDGDVFCYAVASMQGWRTEMEDSHRVSLNLPGQLKDWAFAGVFDGHSGRNVSEYTSKNLLPQITRKIQGYGEKEQNGQRLIKDGIIESFLRLDAAMRKSKIINDNSGTTAVCVLISQSNYYFINCGDSRAILCRDEKVRFVTKDHKPNLKVEKNRIEAAGGTVRHDRVNGCLALSRALGDFRYKDNTNKEQCDQMVSPLPDVTVIERNNRTDRFIVLACDGVFDVLTNYELITLIKSEMAKTNDLRVICKNVADRCLKIGSRDNISIVLLKLPGCQNHEDLRRKRKLDLAHMNCVIRNKKAKKSGSIRFSKVSDPSSSANIPLTQNIIEIKREYQRENKHSTVPNVFITFFLDYWKKKGGNICKAAQICGKRWSRLGTQKREKYKLRYLQVRNKHNLKRLQQVPVRSLNGRSKNKSSTSSK